MNPKMKQRLIGSLVVIALLLIFLPFLLHNPRPVAKRIGSANTPTEPTKPAVNLDLPKTQTSQATTTPVDMESLDNNDSNDNDDETASGKDNTNAMGTPSPNDQPPPIPSDGQPIPVSGPSPTSPNTPAANLPTANPSSSLPSVPTSKEQTTRSEPVKNLSIPVTTKPSPANPTNNTTPPKPASPAESNNANKSVAITAKSAASESVLTKSIMIEKPTAQNNKKAVVQPLLASHPAAEAWVLQLGGFTDPNNATDLVRRLRVQGFDAYVQISGAVNHAMAYVYVGPEIDLDKIKEVKAKIKDKLQMDSIIKKYLV